MNEAIALVGMACRYPDADNPKALWENVLAKRRAFRRLPSERLNLADYFSEDHTMPDAISCNQAAVIEGYEFDRVKYRVAGGTYRSTDLTHWLALDVAAQALEDAGFPEGKGLSKESTSVLVGNTLTGEFSRAALMRLRWPFVRRMVDAELRKQGWNTARINAFLIDLEVNYKKPFEPVGEETLAGGLSNTIAGRICNHFDFKGGGYTLDGACSSSLIAVANACTSLVAGDVDTVVVGGVDLSLDPFELIGFSKMGALAHSEMRVYDVDPNGFLPGEGCGFVVLMRSDDALACGARCYALIRGWGLSSDGSGGITRPEESGQRLALERAYQRAGYGIDTVPLFEGHGTGTPVGDEVELRTLTTTRLMADPNARPAVVGSIKANIGHTKAAAGVAGLLKAVMAVHHQILPPATGFNSPHPLLKSENANLRLLSKGEAWPDFLPLRAGVSSFGFGGINVHLAIEGANNAVRRSKLMPTEQKLLASPQDCELFLLSAEDISSLLAQLRQLAEIAPRLSLGELTDLAAMLARRVGEKEFVRAAVVAATPVQLAERITRLSAKVADGEQQVFEIKEGIFLGCPHPGPRREELGRHPGTRRKEEEVGSHPGPQKEGEELGRHPGPQRKEDELGRHPGPQREGERLQGQGRITLLFPGQASPVRLKGGAWARRFSKVQTLYEPASVPAQEDSNSTEKFVYPRNSLYSPLQDNLNSTAIAQPAIITAELAGLQILTSLGVQGQLALGHSVGEFAALHWAGAMDEATLLEVAKVRGRAMTDTAGPLGAMLSLAVDGDKAEMLCANLDDVNIACFNSPEQTVISGPVEAIERVKQQTQAQGIKATRLPVSHGFHSKLMIPAAKVLAAHLAETTLQPLQRRVISTISGAELEPEADLRTRLKEQMTHPVRFTEALDVALQETDLFIETGPGQVLTELVRQMTDVPVIALDAVGPALQGLLTAIGAAYVMGAPINREALFADRFVRPFSLDWQPKFFANPCELAPQLETSEILETAKLKTAEVLESSAVSESADISETAKLLDTQEVNVLERLRRRIAERADFPLSTIHNNSRPLADLHLSSISVGQIVIEVGQQIGLQAPADPTAYADATLEEIARAMEERVSNGEVEASPSSALPAGIEAWIRAFAVEWVERPIRKNVLVPKGYGGWQVFGDSADPLKRPLEQRLNEWGGGGVVLCLPEKVNENHVGMMLDAAKAVLETERRYFVLVQYRIGAAAFARTLHREHPNITLCVLTLPLVYSQSPGDTFEKLISDNKAVERVLAEVQIANGYHEVRYDAEGIRRERVLKPLVPEYKVPLAQRVVLTADDILLVTGGGKGITAECAAALAQDSGVRLVLLGRASPEKDAELSGNLARLQTKAVNFKYFQTDITDAEAVNATVAEIVREWGPITAILHGAGANQPKLLRNLDETAFQRTLAPKVGGLRHMLAAIEPKHLRLLVSFGSIIATTGMPGEADYAVANEWLAAMTAAFQNDHPDCRCLTLEWSVWSGVGMGRRLGSDEILAQQGITPISPDVGVALFRQLLSLSSWERAGKRAVERAVEKAKLTTVVVTGRMPDVPTLRIERPDMPFLRFLEQPRVYYPGIELVVNVEMSLISDPYLNDHIYKGERLLPAVMGLEAMAQVASAALGVEAVPVFEKVEFSRPVVVEETRSETVQIAALVQTDGTVDIALRCAQTGFKVDHFRARCRFSHLPGPQREEVSPHPGPQREADDSSPAITSQAGPHPGPQREADDSSPAVTIQVGPHPGPQREEVSPHPGPQREADDSSPAVTLQVTDIETENVNIAPEQDLYGSLLFQERRFKRLRAYRHIEATQCLGEIAVDDSQPWFGRYLSPTLILGDPGSRDATIHAIQVCMPHAQLLPIRIDRLNIVNAHIQGPWTVSAKERWRKDDLFCYDLTVWGQNGELRETWEGLHLQNVSPITWQQGWLEPLLAPYIERRVQELIPNASLRVATRHEITEPRRTRSEKAIRKCLGVETELVWRPDGKPEVPNSDKSVSTAHAGDLTLAVAGPMLVACDLEPVVKREDQVWRDLLGIHRDLVEIIAHEAGEDNDKAATRIWTARECLKKAGALLDTPLTLKSSEKTGWILLGAGEMTIVSSVVSVKMSDTPLALAVLYK
ncbi:MAG: erythronolide synthase [Candidatus Parabeggiatoa sp. nov. 2]|nr:MAG: erythronolide synthase [Gammaproteobacteria bacterium]